MKEARPNIPKLTITNIGEFDGPEPINWAFDGSSHNNSVGRYISKDWNLFGGYTADELREIADDP